MEDRSQEVLGKYNFIVYSTYRTRGAYVLDTDQGLKLLCSYEGGEGRVEFEDTIKRQLIQRGYENVDALVRTSAGNLFSINSVGEKYVIRDWFDGDECNLKKEDKVLLASSNLAILHNCMSHMDLTQEQVTINLQNDLNAVMEKRTRELKRVKSYIRERKQKNEFEICYLSVCEDFYKDALLALEQLKELPYAQMMEKARKDCLVCHGSYTYHNILMLKEDVAKSYCKAAQLGWNQEIATTNFDQAECGLQIVDLYYFIRKVMEKNDWDIKLGMSIINEYEKYHCISPNDMKLLSVLLLYPEKFWKVTNYYYNSKKSWIPQKNVQKLMVLSGQMECKKNFLKRLIGSC